jgi:hypothetical protein
MTRNDCQFIKNQLSKNVQERVIKLENTFKKISPCEKGITGNYDSLRTLILFSKHSTNEIICQAYDEFFISLTGYDVAVLEINYGTNILKSLILTDDKTA